jgi:CDP-diacylglycerol---serine O-phosphatidyltransferase
VSPESSRPPLTQFILDPPNLCTLAGLAAATVGISSAVRGVYPAAMIALLWAVVFDWTDGIIARRMKARTAGQRSFGAQLDSFVDVVAFSVAPAVLLLSVGDLGAWFVPGAFAVLVAGVVRLSYFNVFGLLGGATYRGLTLDSDVLVLAALFVAQPIVPSASFAIVVYATLLALVILNLAPFEMPKLGGRWYWAIVAYASGLSVVFGVRLL